MLQIDNQVVMEHSKHFHEIPEAWLMGEISLDVLGHMLQQGDIKLSEYLAIRLLGETKSLKFAR